MRRSSPTSSRPPGKAAGFFWQGALILLPALLLAGAGLYSLRQDRLLALREAAEQGKNIATELVRRRLPHFPAVASAGLKPGPAPGALLGDPVLAATRASIPFLLCCVDAGGQLVYPPPVPSLVQARPWEAEGLSAALRTEWESAQTALAHGDHLEVAAETLRRFLAQGPTDRFRVAAHYQLGLLELKQGRLVQAQPLFQAVADHPGPDPLTEAGYSWRTYAQWHLLQTAIQLKLPEAQREPFLVQFGQGLVYRPSPLTGLLLDQLDALEVPRLVAPWRQLWQAHEAARTFHTEVRRVLPAGAYTNPAVFRPVWLTPTAQGPWLVAPATEGPWHWLSGLTEDQAALWRPAWVNASTGHWLVGLTEDQARRLILEMLRTLDLPAYLGLTVEVAGRGLVHPAEDSEVLAEAASPGLRGWRVMGHPDQAEGNPAFPLLDGRVRSDAWKAIGYFENRPVSAPATVPEAGPPWFKVKVHLISPARLYARQRLRTWWFGALIVASGLTVVAGWLAAWRAFRRQQQLSELRSNFVSSVSHELRAPIASLRLMAEELQDLGASVSPKAREYHHLMVQECRRLSGLIENVLDFSRHEQGRKQYEFEPTDVVALVQATVKLMEPYALERGLQLVFQNQWPADPTAATPLPAGLPGNPAGPGPTDSPPTSDPTQTLLDGQAVQQALVNLMDNAIKHSPAGATVTVGLALRPAAPPSPAGARRPHPAARNGPHLELFVEDQGPGIPPEEHERIFERFYRRGSELRRETQGIGLGLAIVKYVAEAHGGRVTVRSALSQGSRFTLALPLGNLETELPSPQK